MQTELCFPNLYAKYLYLMDIRHDEHIFCNFIFLCIAWIHSFIHSFIITFIGSWRQLCSVQLPLLKINFFRSPNSSEMFQEKRCCDSERSQESLWHNDNIISSYSSIFFSFSNIPFLYRFSFLFHFFLSPSHNHFIPLFRSTQVLNSFFLCCSLPCNNLICWYEPEVTSHQFVDCSHWQTVGQMYMSFYQQWANGDPGVVSMLPAKINRRR